MARFPNTLGLLDPLRLGALSLFILVGAGSVAPVRADPGAIAPSEFSRYYEGRLERLAEERGALEVFKVRAYAIYFIEFQNAEIQSRSLDRIGIFVESDRYHGKILSPQLIQKLPEGAFYDGHDYALEDVARFYSYAARLAIRLDPREEQLKQLLMRLGLMMDVGGKYMATHRAALLSAVAGLDERYGAGTRRAVLDHEFRHGYYFVRLEKGVHEIWRKMLTDRERELIAAALQMTARYDTSNPSLMEREFHALVFESRFEDDVRSLSVPGRDGRAEATPAEVEALVGKLPEIRRAFVALEKRLISISS